MEGESTVGKENIVFNVRVHSTEHGEESHSVCQEVEFESELLEEMRLKTKAGSRAWKWVRPF